MPGEFSRGGIIDIWPPNLRRPVRIELFGDEVDSLRSFDPSTQRTLDRLQQVWLGPASKPCPSWANGPPDRCKRSTCATAIRRRASSSSVRSTACWPAAASATRMVHPLSLQPAGHAARLPAGRRLAPAGRCCRIAHLLDDLDGQAEQLARDLAAAGDVPAVAGRAALHAPACVARLSARPTLLWAMVRCRAAW